MSLNEYELLSAHQAAESMAQTAGLHVQVLSHDTASHDGRIIIKTGEGSTFDLPYKVKTTQGQRKRQS